MSFGSHRETGGDLSHPACVAIDSDGDVYVTDWGNRRVQIFEPSGDVLTALYGDANALSKAGRLFVERDVVEREADIRTNAGVPLQPRFIRPVGIAADDENRIIITDVSSRLQVYVKNAMSDGTAT